MSERNERISRTSPELKTQQVVKDPLGFLFWSPFRVTRPSRVLAIASLRRGDVVRVVDNHPSANGEIGYSIEVFNALGDTIAVTTVPESTLEPLHKDEVLSVRPLTAAK